MLQRVNPAFWWEKSQLHLALWAPIHVPQSTNKESIYIRDLFQDAKMCENIHIKNIVENRPSADVYLAAKAKALGAIVVTTETYKPTSAQLPNICEAMGVKCISYDDFMEILSE